MLEQWTGRAVRKEIAFALKVVEVTTSPVKQRQVKALMPSYEYSLADMNGQYLFDIEQSRKGEATLQHRNADRLRPSSEQIRRSEEILLGTRLVKPWLKFADAYPTHQAFLVEAVKAASEGIGDRRLCRERDWNLSTFQRYRDHAADVIAGHLNRLGVVPWH